MIFCKLIAKTSLIQNKIKLSQQINYTCLSVNSAPLLINATQNKKFFTLNTY